MKRLFVKAAGVAAAAALLKACGGGGGGGSPPPAGGDSLLALVQADGNLSTFAAAIGKSGLDRYVAAGSLTLFAASNAAMDDYGARLGFGNGNGLVNGLSSAQWASILSYSTLPQALSLDTLELYAQRDTRPDTLYSFEDKDNARQLIFLDDNGLAIVGGVTSPTIERGNVGASNGVLHVVSAPVVPRGVITVLQMLQISSASFVGRMGSSTFAQLSNTSSRFTVFVPSVDAGPLTDNGVRHHVLGSRLDSNAFVTTSLAPLAGQQLLMTVSSNASVRPTLRNSGGGTTLTISDVDFWGSNGVIHVINGVIPL